MWCYLINSTNKSQRQADYNVIREGDNLISNKTCLYEAQNVLTIRQFNLMFL